MANRSMVALQKQWLRQAIAEKINQRVDGQLQRASFTAANAPDRPIRHDVVALPSPHLAAAAPGA
jgi:hypothetical protein